MIALKALAGVLPDNSLGSPKKPLMLRANGLISDVSRTATSLTGLIILGTGVSWPACNSGGGVPGQATI